MDCWDRPSARPLAAAVAAVQTGSLPKVRSRRSGSRVSSLFSLPIPTLLRAEKPATCDAVPTADQAALRDRGGRPQRRAQPPPAARSGGIAPARAPGTARRLAFLGRGRAFAP